MALTHEEKRRADYKSLMSGVEEKITPAKPSAMAGALLKPPLSTHQLGGIPKPTRTMPDVLQAFDQSALYKAVIPEWLYKPIFGKPRNVNVPEMRRLAKTPQIAMCVNTIINEVTSIPWEIQPKDPNNYSQAHIDEVTEFLKDPNRNKENFKLILRQLVQDVLEIDAAVLVKIYDYSSYYEDPETGMWFLKPLGMRKLVGIKPYDGINFTANPDSYGILPEQMAYWQYSWATYQRPTAFARDEIVYMLQYPQTTSGVYGRSPVELLMDIAQALLYSVNYQKEFYDSNAIPQGILSVLDASDSHIKAMRARWDDYLLRTDEFGNKRRYFHKIPITNQDTKFTSITLSPVELQVLESQKIWLDIVMAVFNITPSELGFTQDVNRATDLSQTEAFKRKAVRPILELLKFHINTEIISEFQYDDIEFNFVEEDMVDIRRKKEIAWQELKLKVTTPNEYREKFGKDENEKAPLEWGDEPVGAGSIGAEIGQSMDEAFSELSPNDESPKPPAGFRSWEEAIEEFEKKAITTTTGGAGTPGSALAVSGSYGGVYPTIPNTTERKLAKIISSWLNGRLMEIMKDLKHQVDVQGKALDRNILEKVIERVTSFLRPSDTMRMEIAEVARTGYMYGHEAAEKALNMNVEPDTKMLTQIQNMMLNDVVGMTDDIAKNVRRVLNDGYMKGESIRDLANRIKGVFEGLTEARSKMIARTTLVKAANQGRVEAYKDSGVVQKLEWITAKDNRVCKEHCKKLDGKVFGIKDAPRPVIDTHPNCRCMLIPYFEK